VPPLEIGRGTDPTICIICQEINMATIEQVTETVTQEIFILKYTRAELETMVDEPTPYLRDIRDVLNGSHQKPTATAKPKRKSTGKVKGKPILHCQYCRAKLINPGSHAKHQARCVDNPANNAPQE